MTTVTAIFDTALDANNAVKELEAAGIPSANISLLMNESVRERDYKDPDALVGEETKAQEGIATGAVLGGALGALAMGLTAVGSIAIPGLGLVAAGPIAAILAGAGAGGTVGGFLGGLIGLGIPETEAKFYESRLKEGGILLAVNSSTPEETKRVKSILERNDARKIAA